MEEDHMRTDLARRSGAELVGTALLVLFGAGSVVASLTVGKGQLTYPGLGFISLAFAIIVALVIYVFGPVSGAHINPAVTIALAVTRRFPWVEVLPYVVAQLVGGVIGGLLIVATFGTQAVDLGLGATSLGSGVPYGQGIVAEALGTFILLLAVMGLAVDTRAPLGWAGLMIGLAVALEILLIGPQTGGSINPARTFGPYVTLSVFGGDVSWSQFGVYVAGPVVGGILAVLLYDLLAPTRPVRRPAMEDSYEPGDPQGASSTPSETSIRPTEEG
jgi:glycerol uptake facilitator protein